jgi:hypothetical protein
MTVVCEAAVVIALDIYAEAMAPVPIGDFHSVVLDQRPAPATMCFPRHWKLEYDDYNGGRVQTSVLASTKALATALDLKFNGCPPFHLAQL